MEYLEQLQTAGRSLRDRIGEPPPVALVLGSGLSDALWQAVDMERIDYGEIPYFPVSSVVGHSGQLAWGESGATRFCALAGRVHLYEDISPRRVVFAVRALALWGVEHFIITNAAGAIRTEFSPGELMLITDHINLQGRNPLLGDNLDELGPRFPDMSQAYDRGLLERARRCALDLGVSLREGVYVALAGPSYETPAEIRMCATLGADAVGMSTVPEVIALNHMSRKVMGISCLTNMAAGILSQPLDHDEVLETTHRSREDFSRLLLRVVAELGGPR